MALDEKWHKKRSRDHGTARLLKNQQKTLSSASSLLHSLFTMHGFLFFHLFPGLVLLVIQYFLHFGLNGNLVVQPGVLHFKPFFGSGFLPFATILFLLYFFPFLLARLGLFQMELHYFFLLGLG